MAYSSHIRLGPTGTPRSLKYLLFATLGISLFAVVTDRLFPSLLGWPSPLDFLSLSAAGIKKYFLWEFFSYLFVYPSHEGISFSFLLSVAFNTYILWLIGVSLIEKKGSIQFFLLYFLSGIVSGGIIFGLQLMHPAAAAFAGNIPALYAILIAWALLFPEAHLLLFFAFPFKAKWLIYGSLIFNLLIDLSIGEWGRAVAALSGGVFGFLYAKLLWIRTPKQPFIHTAKRYDFKTGKALLSDDEFLEAMLTKISLHGQKSLTWKERWKLNRISKNKRHH